MFVDPLLLVALLVLLVGTSALAVVAYVRYRRCEDVYRAYGHIRTNPAPAPPPAPVPPPADDRYVAGADYAEVPTPGVLPSEPPLPVEPEAPPILPEPEVAPPVLADVRIEPAAPAPAESDTFFYEYTAQGFVPVDPYEPAPVPAPDEAHIAAEPATMAPGTYRSAGDGNCEEPLRQEETERGHTVTAPVATEDGFVWL